MSYSSNKRLVLVLIIKSLDFRKKRATPVWLVDWLVDDPIGGPATLAACL